MKLFHNLKHWLQLKVYHACLNIAKEREEENLNDILSLMKFHGKPLNVKKGYSILGSQYMEFGAGCILYPNAWVECIDQYGNQRFKPSLVVGKRFTMQRYGHIGCINSIEIGDNVMLGSKVFITDHYHGHISKDTIDIPPADRLLVSKPVKVGNNVWVGDNVSIMPGITIGDNVIIGANSVITHSFPANVVIAGVPAKIIKILR